MSDGNEYISNPKADWSTLDPKVKYDFQNYIATFEDIGLARASKIISKTDFKVGYGGRYGKLLTSRAMASFKASAGFEDWHFKNLEILNQDIGVV